MDARQFGGTYHSRPDRGDEVVASILNVRRRAPEILHRAVHGGDRAAPRGGGVIGSRLSPETGTGFWDFDGEE